MVHGESVVSINRTFGQIDLAYFCNESIGSGVVPWYGTAIVSPLKESRWRRSDLATPLRVFQKGRDTVVERRLPNLLWELPNGSFLS
ncbi:hypothetical protein MRX96_029768 [Rhipicephalus microplus]